MQLIPYATKYRVIKKSQDYHTDFNSQRQSKLLPCDRRARGNKYEKAVSPYWSISCINLLVTFYVSFNFLRLGFVYLRLSSNLPMYKFLIPDQSLIPDHPAFTSTLLRLYLHDYSHFMRSWESKFNQSLCVLGKHSATSYIPRLLCSRKAYELLLQICNTTEIISSGTLQESFYL